MTLGLDPVEPPASLSPSSISSFKECPLAFRFSYLDRLPQPPAPHSSKGTLVHRALERFYDRPADERTAAALDRDLGRVQRARAAEGAEGEFAEVVAALDRDRADRAACARHSG